MKLIKLYYLLLLLSILSLSSCDLRDDFMELCYKPYIVIVSMDYNDDRQVDFSEYREDDVSLMRNISDVIIYVFDNNNRYLGCHFTKANKLTELPYPAYDSINVVSVFVDKEAERWANMLIKGNYYDDEDVFIKLDELTGQNTRVAKSPTDFMFSRNSLTKNLNTKKNVVNYIYTRSMVGAMKICTKNMQKWADMRYGKTNAPNDVFTFVVGQTLDEYNFQGILQGEHTSYIPNTEHINYETVNTEMFNTFPAFSKSGVVIEIFRNGESIFPDPETKKKYAFTIIPGWCMKVDIVFNSNGGADIDVEDWGNVDVDVEL